MIYSCTKISSFIISIGKSLCDRNSNVSNLPGVQKIHPTGFLKVNRIDKILSKHHMYIIPRQMVELELQLDLSDGIKTKHLDSS